MMELAGTDRAGLVDYLTAQIDHLFPDGKDGHRAAIAANLDGALDRMGRCVGAARMWRPDRFDYLHSEQNAVFLAYLANTCWQAKAAPEICTKIFYLNKALNGFTCFYDVPLPDYWFVGHSVGIVLVRTQYPNYFAIWQNATVGRNGDDLPALGEGLVMYPNTAIVGRCDIGAGTVVSQGTSIINRDTPGNAVVFDAGGKLAFKPPKRDIIGEIFRL